MKQKSNILVCIDTTSASSIAVRYACYKANKTGFTVHILAVIEASYKSLLFAAQAVGKDKRMQLEEHLRKLMKEIHAETGITPTVSIREGDIAEEIIKEIKNDEDCAMVVLGKSRSSLSDNMVLPMISKRIGTKIKVPVVIVPENMDEDHLKRLA